MHCNSCGMKSVSLREYSRVVDLGKHRKTIDTMYLCGACRVLNVINPKYIAKRLGNDISLPGFAIHPVAQASIETAQA